MGELTNQSPFSRQNDIGSVVSLTDTGRAIAEGEGTFLLTKASASDITMILPPAAGNCGRYLAFILVSMAGSNDYIITDAGDDVEFLDLTLDTAGDRALLWCCGRHWWVIASEIT